MGVMLPVLIGISGLALDGSLWYAQKRSAQAIADTAAYSVMLEVERAGDVDLAKTAAKADAVTYGLDEAAGDSITFNIPPTSGDYAGVAGYYEVIVERPAAVFLAGLIVNDFDTAARAVSGGADGSPPPCLLASDPTMQDAFKVNNGTVNSTGCDIQVNSSDDSALNVAKNGTLTADPINIVGNYVEKGTISSDPNVDMPSITRIRSRTWRCPRSRPRTAKPPTCHTAVELTTWSQACTAAASVCPATPRSRWSLAPTSSPAMPTTRFR